MTNSEPRDTVQIYFCELCQGPGTCYIRATKQRLCMTCLKTRTMLLNGTRHVIHTSADGTPKLIIKPRKHRRKGSQSPERLYFYELQKGLCYYCEKPIPSVRSPDWTIEHKMPVCRGGTNLISNLAGACNQCNHNKGPLTEHEFKTITSPADRKALVRKISEAIRTRKQTS